MGNEVMKIKTDPYVNISTDLTAMEKVWAKELYELSLKEREIINNELHGVSVSEKYANEEEGWSKERYSFYVGAFQRELDTSVSIDDKQAYLRGLALGSSYILSSDFRLGFLRAERYDIGKATRRYCRCLDFLLEYFGECALLRPLLISDLTKKEAKFLREGYVQILPSRDRLGRRILIQLGSYGGTEYSEVEKFRVNVYLCFAVLSIDVTTQRLGVVSLASFTLGAEQAMKRESRTISKLIKEFFAAVPLRWSAAHLCIPDDPIFHFVKALVLFFLGVNGRRMLRIHTGTPMECDYALRSFGIPTDDIPRTHTHTIKLKNHSRFVKVRKLIDTFVKKAIASNELAYMQFPGIECPDINCVLFGRYAWEHPGNVEFRGLVTKVFVAKGRDADLPDQIRPMVKNVIEDPLFQKFRFLMYDRKTFLYQEVTEYKEVWDLIEQSLRMHRKRIRAKRVMDEAVVGIDGFVGKENTDVSTISMVSQERNNCGKFMKDCDGCKRRALE